MKPLITMQRTRIWVGHPCGRTRQGRRRRALRRLLRRLRRSGVRLASIGRQV